MGFESRLVRAHGLAAIGMLFASLVFGTLVALELVWPDLGQGAPWLSWGRLRYDHTQGIMLGWLGNAFFAFLYHAVPILTGRRLTSEKLGEWLFGIWNFLIVIPGWTLVLAGVSQPLEWAEFPLVIDGLVVVAFVLAAVQFLPPFFTKGLEELYVSSWYIIGGLVFTLLAYPMGNLVPELVPGARGAAFSGLWIHDAVGLYVTPMALAVVYFVIPAAMRRPVYSHFLSMLGFWLLFFLYPLNGMHHYVFSVIPMDAQKGAILASALLGVDVVIVVVNLMLSLRGSGWFPKDLPLRFVSTAAFLYLVVSIQGSMQAQMELNRAVHFSDWVVGHSHLAMLGFATFAAAGGITHAWQRMPGARFHAKAIAWAYWLLLGGLLVMVADLTVAGLMQAHLWESPQPWLEAVKVSKPFWLVRALTSVPITAGFVMLLVGLLTGERVAGVAVAEEVEPKYAPAVEGAR